MDVCRLKTACLFGMLAGRLFSANPAIGFEENKGQYPKEILYASRLGAYVTSTAFVVGAPKGTPVSLQFVNASPGVQSRPGDTLAGPVNVIGAGATITGVRQYAGVQWTGVYPGIDASLVVRSNTLILRLNLAAGASVNPLLIGVSVPVIVETPSGGGGLSMSGGPLLRRPGAGMQYSQIDSTHFTVVLDPSIVDTSQPVTTDMTVPNSKELETVETVTAPSGSYYVLVNAPEALMPAGGYDVAAFKFSADGDPQYVTYLRGSGNQQVRRGATRQRSVSSGLSPGDLVCLTGETSSSDFPVTPNAAQKANAGNGDVFVAALDGNTGGLVYATFLGGPNADAGYDLHLDSGNGVYVTGNFSAGLPVTRTLFPPVECTHCAAKWAAAIDISTGGLRYLTYLPGVPMGANVDAAGNLYFTGYADSSFPVTKGAYLTQIPGGTAPFVARLNADGTALDFATYLGASGLMGHEIAVDSHGNAWIIGGDAFYNQSFLAKVDSTGSKLAYYSPFFGGDILVDGSDNLVFFTSSHAGTTMATASGMLRESCGFDYLAMLDPAGALILERALPGLPLGLDNRGNLLVDTLDGVTAINLTPNSRGWAACLYNAASWDRQNKVAPGEIISIMGAGLGPAQGSAFRPDAQGRVPTATGGTRVLFNGMPGPVLYSQEGQVNAIVPFGISPGSSLTVQVEYQGQALAPLTVPVSAAQPGVFTADGSGSGQVVAVNQDGTMNSVANPAPAGSIVSVFVNGLGATSPASVEGAVAASMAPRPTAAYTVYFFGLADVVYLGPSPGSLSSVVQINLRVPSIPAGPTLRLTLSITQAAESYVSQLVWVAARSQQ